MIRATLIMPMVSMVLVFIFSCADKGGAAGVVIGCISRHKHEMDKKHRDED